MKKRIIRMALAVVMAVCLTACGTRVETVSKEDNSSMFVVVESTSYWRVVYNKKTKVMYAVSSGSYNYGTFTLLVNADGTPMIYEESED